MLPPITMSCSHEHVGFPGTVSISAKTLYAMSDDIHGSLARFGTHKLVIVNGHGENYVLSNVVQGDANVDGPVISLLSLSSDWDRTAFATTPVSLPPDAGKPIHRRASRRGRRPEDPLLIEVAGNE
ncbi:creatininase family protein [Streptomyces sp. NPDC052077]|uniref:creatininase family protein n=1 Tax=Streptomyces sp. NPDC052077 TaxID=3154757 RepID=UPI00343A27C2